MKPPEVLAAILTRKREEVAARRQALGDAALRSALERADPPRGFAQQLARVSATGTAVIAEVKRASPSAGDIWRDLDPAAVARAYAAGGAACLSVLTDQAGFGGSDEDLQRARAAVDLPVLRKDFIIDPWQVLESRALGADCVLLIVAALDDAELVTGSAMALELGMDVLVEVHDEAELERALRLDPRCLLGVNNRDLRVMRTDLATSERLAARMPEGRIRISESGIATPADVQRLAAAGYRCLLVGEGLVRTRAPGEALAALLG